MRQKDIPGMTAICRQLGYDVQSEQGSNLMNAARSWPTTYITSDERSGQDLRFWNSQANGNDDLLEMSKDFLEKGGGSQFWLPNGDVELIYPRDRAKYQIYDC